MLKIAGKLLALGNLTPAAPQQGVDAQAGAVLSLPDGRLVTISGLTKDEVRKLAGDFGEPLTLKLEGLPC